VRLFSVNGQKAMRIGDVLLEHERITEFQLKHALERQAESKVRLGEILVELGLVTPDEIESAIRTQAEEEIFEIFSLKEGEFRFAERELAEQEYRPDPAAPDNAFDVGWLVGEVARRVDEWQRLAEDFKGDTDVFVMPPESRTASLAALPDGAPKRLAEMLNGTNTIGDLVHRLLLPRYKIYRTLAELMRDGHARQATPEELRENAGHLREQKQVKQAVKLLEHAFGLDPANGAVVRELAELHEAVGDKKRAGSFYKALADISFNSGEPDQGAILCQKVAEFLPNDPYPHERLVEHNIARDQRARALESARVLLRLYQHEGEIDRATELCRSFLEMFPDDVGLHERMINLHLAAGRQPDAVGEYEIMADLVAADPTIEPGAKDKTRLEIFQKILRIDPSRADVRKIVEELSGTTDEIAAEKKRKTRRVLAIVAIVVLIIGGFAGGYEFKARSDFASLKAAKQRDDEMGLAQTANNWRDFMASYGWSSVVGDAKLEMDRVEARLNQVRKERMQREARLRDDVIEVERRFESGNLKAAESLANQVVARDGGGKFGAKAHQILNKIADARLRAAEARAREQIDAAAAEEKKATAQSMLEARRMLRQLGEITDPHLHDQRETALKRVVKKLRGLFLTQAQEHFANGRLYRADDDLENAEREWQIALANLRQDVLEGVKAAEKLRKQIQDEYDKLVRYLREARQLYERIKIAEKEQRWADALKMVQRLVRDYPIAPMVEDGSVKASMRITSEPTGATVRRGEEVLGTTPCVVRYPPNKRIPFVVSLRGWKPQIVEGDGTQHERHATFEKTWYDRVEIGGDVVASPLLLGDRLIVGARTQRVRGLDLGAAPGTGWIYDLKALGEVRATPTRVGDRIYVVATNNDTVHALELKGDEPPVALWVSQRLEGPPRGPVLANADGSALALIGRGGILWSLDPAAGTHTKVAALGYEPAGRMARTGDRLWIVGDDVKLHVVNAVDGSEIAAVPLPARGSPGVQAAAGVVYVGAGRDVWAFSADAAPEVLAGGGKVFAGAEGSIAGLAVTGERCVAVTRAATVVLWDVKAAPGANGNGVTPLWQARQATTGLGNPAIHGAHVLLGSRAGRVLCLQLKDGVGVWGIDVPGPVQAAPVAWRDRVLVPCEDAHLYSIAR
jgi:tetratricopeptide (TPR) repeat protein/outer membrane protein assembly factor BamB